MRATELPSYVIFQQRFVTSFGLSGELAAYSRLGHQITMVGPLGLLISNYCIIRYLASVVTPNKMIESRESARRRMVSDYLASFGFPACVALVSVVFQVARYQVNNLVGCSSVSVLTWPTLFTYLIWSPILCGISCGYSGELILSIPCMNLFNPCHPFTSPPLSLSHSICYVLAHTPAQESQELGCRVQDAFEYVTFYSHVRTHRDISLHICTLHHHRNHYHRLRHWSVYDFCCLARYTQQR